MILIYFNFIPVFLYVKYIHYFVKMHDYCIIKFVLYLILIIVKYDIRENFNYHHGG